MAQLKIAYAVLDQLAISTTTPLKKYSAMIS
jgi:hypothetical protein